MKTKQRFLSLLLCGVMLFSLYPASVFAEAHAQDSGIAIGAGGFCEHHTEHNEACGYTEGAEGTPCGYICKVCTAAGNSMISPLADGTITESGITIEYSNGGSAAYTEDSGFQITANGDYIISGEWNGSLTVLAGDNRKSVITIPDGVTANITIKGLTIIADQYDASKNFGTFKLQGNAVCNLTLEGNNTLKSGSGDNGGNITIFGGTVTATGGNDGAGIGGGDSDYQGNGGNITIFGGTVTATGGNYAAGIGGGYSGSGGTITIEEGTVKATGGYCAAGIGSGMNGNGGTIIINGGSVEATGGDRSAGIGGGYKGSGGDITISGGNVTVQGADAATDIGHGQDGNSSDKIEISGNAKVTRPDNQPVNIGASHGADNSKWNHDDTHHWHPCKIESCKNENHQFEKEEHSLKPNDNDCTTAEVCSICKTEIIAAKTAHEPQDDDGDCTTAIKCKNCDVIITAAKTAHEPQDDDGDCTTAIKCKNCDMIITAAKTAHEPQDDDGDCTTAIKCKNCDVIITAAETAHNFASEAADEKYLKSAAACTTQAVYYKSCSACGTSSEGTASEATFESGNLDPNNHINKEVQGKKDPTATEAGYTGDIFCNDCRKIVQTGSVIPVMEYTITFDGNGGTDPAPQTTAGKKLTSLPKSTRNGYSFNGWHTARTDGEEITLNTVFTASVTVYAQWTESALPNQYDVTVQTDGSGIAFATPASAAAGTTVTLTATADAGFHFKEWQVISGDVTITNNSFIMPAENVIVKATFEKDTVQSKIETSNITEVPEGLKDTAFNTVEKIKNELTRVLMTQAGYTKGNTVLYDVRLQISTDGGQTWIDADEENFPAEGITVMLPYPSGTGKATHNFVVTHMFTVTSLRLGTTAGQTEQPAVRKTDTGLEVTLKGLSPVGIAWKAIGSDTSGTGDNSGSVSGGDAAPTYYTLTFETNGGGSIDAVKKISGTKIDLTGYQPTRKDYDFNGWYADKALTEKITAIQLNSNKTIYAGWTKQAAPIEPSKENPFTDVRESDWFYDDVLFVYDKGIMTGTGKTTFSPYQTVTRGMMAAIIWRMEGSPKADDSSELKDVPQGSYYTEAVQWAMARGIMNGYGDGIFRPDEPVTREQLAGIFSNYAQYKGCDLTPADSLTGFTDKDDISDWARNAMQWAVGSGLISGKGNGILDPQGTAARAEIVAMLHRFL